MRRLALAVSLFTILFVVSNTAAQPANNSTVPNLIRYNGTVLQPRSAVASSQVVGVTFAIYKQQEGGAPVWLETQNVTLDASGHYSVLLGSTISSGLPGDLFSQQEQRWLGVQAQGQAEQPRVLLVSVPYAMKAAEADTLAGHSASEFVTTDTLQTAVQQLQQQVPKGASATSVSATGASTHLGVTPAVTNPATNFVDNTTNQVVSIQQNGTGVALIASAPSNTAIVGASRAGAIAGIIAGVEAVTSVPIGYGLYARQMSSTAPGNTPTGVYAQSDSPNGAAIRAWEPYGSGATVGIAGGAASTGGTAIYAAETAASGATFGLLVKVFSPAGTGALIVNTAGGTITGPLLQAKTNTGVKFSLDGSGNVNAAGTISGSQLLSAIATGTAPFRVASTTQVANLNASLLGGSPASAFAAASGSPSYIQNGTALQTGANFNISGNGSANSFNSATTYGIGGSSVLSIGTPADGNVFLGMGAGSSNVAGQGVANAFVGYQTGHSNMTGRVNVFVGYQTGYSNTTGYLNTFSGSYAGFSNTAGNENTFTGFQAGYGNGTGYYNTFTGLSAGYNNTNGIDNTFTGVLAGFQNGAGSFNTYDGAGAGNDNSGSYNTFVGSGAGERTRGGNFDIYIGNEAGTSNIPGNNNIYIGSLGCAFYCYENSTIRIGGDVQSGYGAQTATYIAGIAGATVSGVAVYVDTSTGQLGVASSSRRFKEQIADMGDSTNAMMKLHPVTFLYKPEYDKGPRTLQYGLIAEEVAEVYPGLVAYEPDGKPYTVKYQYLTTMLLNEMQKQYHRAEAQAEVIKTQQQEIDVLRAQLQLQNAAFQERLSRLESMVGTQTQTAANSPHQ